MTADDDKTIAEWGRPEDEQGAAGGSDPTVPSNADTLPQIPGVALRNEIARGGMGVVYSGVQEYLQREVAVKVLAAHLQDAEFVRRFKREAQILACISHSNIVRCYDAGMSSDGRCYLVMEYIQGPTMRERAAGRPMTVPEVVRVVRDVGSALEHALDEGIIHRDVKPENILLAEQTKTRVDGAISVPFVPKLVDLGIARRETHDSGMLTGKGIVMGTQSTMAPEQFDDPDSVDHRADIYGLGCTAFFGLTGERAFSGTYSEVIIAKRCDFGPDPQTLNGNVPEPLARLVREMLAGDREQRPQSYRDLIDRCDAILADLEVSATAPTMPVTSDQVAAVEEARRAQSRRGPVRMYTGFAVALVVAGLAIAGAVQWPSGSRGEGSFVDDSVNKVPAAATEDRGGGTGVVPTEAGAGSSSAAPSGSDSGEAASGDGTAQSGDSDAADTKPAAEEPSGSFPVVGGGESIDLADVGAEGSGWELRDSKEQMNASFALYDTGIVTGMARAGLSLCVREASRTFGVRGTVRIKRVWGPARAGRAGFVIDYKNTRPLFLSVEPETTTSNGQRLVVRLEAGEGGDLKGDFDAGLAVLTDADGQPIEMAFDDAEDLELRIASDGKYLYIQLTADGQNWTRFGRRPRCW